jgi:O-6-methylguanine DNA methyltransferase
MTYSHAKNILFAERVREVVRGIKRGTVLSYGEVAKLAGSPNASRAVGTIMRNNFDPTVPCHRVVRADGVIGEYNRGGADMKRSLLKKEGVMFTSTGKIDISLR